MQRVSEDDAYIIFETLNSRGKDLRASDLIRNLITRLIPKKHAKVDEAKRKFNEARQVIEEANHSISYDTFLLHCWISTFSYTSMSKLFVQVKSSIAKHNVHEYLNSLSVEAPMYNMIQAPRQEDWEKNQMRAYHSLYAIQKFRVQQATPLVLSLIEANQVRDVLSHKVLLKALSLIEDFHYLFTAVSGSRGSGGTAQMYASHARQVRTAQDSRIIVDSMTELLRKMLSLIPSQEEFSAKFSELIYLNSRSKDRFISRYSLMKIDNIWRISKSFSKSVDYDKYSIEHLIPQSQSAIPDDVKGSIGNLILVDEILNQKLGTKPPLKKIAALNTVPELPKFGLESVSIWNDAAIRDRTTVIAKTIYDNMVPLSLK